MGRAITGFGAEVDALQLRWQSPSETAPGQTTSEGTPLWEYLSADFGKLWRTGWRSIVAELEEK